MNSHWEDEFIILAIKVVEMVPPQVFHITRIDPTMGVRHLLNEPSNRKLVLSHLGLGGGTSSEVNRLYTNLPESLRGPILSL